MYWYSAYAGAIYINIQSDTALLFYTQLSWVNGIVGALNNFYRTVTNLGEKNRTVYDYASRKSALDSDAVKYACK